MEAECHVNVLRQDKSIGAFVLCNVRLHLEPREGGGGGRWVMMKLSYIKTRTINITTTFLLVHNVTEETERLCYQASGTVYMASLQQGKY